MEAAAEVVADPAARHSNQRLLDDFPLPLEATSRVVHAGQEKLERGRMRELGRGPKTPVANVEQPRHLIRDGGQEIRGNGAGLRLVERLRYVLANDVRIVGDAIVLPADGASVTRRAPLRAATWPAIGALDDGSAMTSLTPASFIRAVSSASDAADGGTPGAGSMVATTTRPKRRAK